jgi:hypothetical protein
MGGTSGYAGSKWAHLLDLFVAASVLKVGMIAGGKTLTDMCREPSAICAENQKTFVAR